VTLQALEVLFANEQRREKNIDVHHDDVALLFQFSLNVLRIVSATERNVELYEISTWKAGCIVQ
jgi:hypothetical protein